jgi:hypothetical protein
MPTRVKCLDRMLSRCGGECMNHLFIARTVVAKPVFSPIHDHP